MLLDICGKISVMKDRMVKVRGTSSSWQVNQLRATIFFGTPTEFVSNNIWPKLKDVSLDRETLSPKTGEKILEGSIDNQKLTLKMMPIRIDLIITTEQEIDMKTASFPYLGTVDKIFKGFSSFFASWITQKDFPNTNFKRIAFGSNLLKEASSHVEAYDKLSQYMAFKVEGHDSSDFRYQINKQRNSKVMSELTINRLTLWDALKFNLELMGPTGPSDSHKYPDKYFSHLLLDINTKPDNEIKISNAPKVFDELVFLGREISEIGIKK